MTLFFDPVWYVAYGSNVLYARMISYVSGGTSAAFGGAHPGARDRRPPRSHRLVRLRHAIYFAGHSRRWNSAVAFVEPTTSDVVTLARSYLITVQQLEDIAAQENGRSAIPPLVEMPSVGEWTEIDVQGKYNLLLGVPSSDGTPAVTLTTNRNLVRASPSQSYLTAIETGLSEVPELNVGELAAYVAALRRVARADY